MSLAQRSVRLLFALPGLACVSEAPPKQPSDCATTPTEAGAGAESPVSVHSLLREMLTLGDLARAPAHPFRTCMVSSYDRASKVPTPSEDSPVGWYANHDWGNYAGRALDRVGEQEAVLLDCDGPGVLVRIWSATPSGLLRVYLDHAMVPAIEAPMADLLAGKIAPFAAPFAGITAKGGNLELPLPFRTHARVTWAGDVGFYQITYRKYDEPSLEVTSFQLDQLDQADLDLASAHLRMPPQPEAALVSQAVLTAEAPELSLASAVRGEEQGEELLQLQVVPSSSDANLLRATILTMSFDGEETVRVPLGDFFGAGPGLLPHATLPLQQAPDGTLTARFVMPFRRSAVVRLEGDGLLLGLRADVRVMHKPAAFTSNTYYFHAHWTARGPMSARPYRDIAIADLAGSGAYVGTFLAVGNSSLAWWGEGDEKVWVDDEAFPSLFGTGTEDYFGQAYSSPDVYDHPFRAQSLAAGDFGAANGLFSMLRLHILDPIRFASSLRFDLELWHWDEAAQVTFDTVTYFYLSPGGTDRLPAPALADYRLSPFSRSSWP